MTWIKFAELENALGDADRARAIFSMAIEQQALDMPEVLWKAYIDFEIEQEDYDKVRALYKILLERTNHIKVWISWIEFEIKVENFDKARETFKVANDALQKSTAEERILLLEKWLEFERQNGTPEQVKVVEDQVPKRIKRRRQILAEDGTDAGWEEYYDYIFPKDQSRIFTCYRYRGFKQHNIPIIFQHLLLVPSCWKRLISGKKVKQFRKKMQYLSIEM